MSDLFAQLQASLGDEYALERELAPNGPSRVFIARERIFNRAILIKVLRPECAQGIDFDRFATDVERAAALNHPNVVPPLMLGVADGLPYIITPYVPGVTLRERLLEQPPLSLEEIVGTLRNLAESLHAAHAQQLHHFDVHPGTILLSQRAALVTDIGTVRALRAARPAGSPFVGDASYLAPEQLTHDGNPDHRADLYAWGCVAYEMLTGMTPSPRSVRDGVVVDAPFEEPAPITLVRRDVPASLIRLIMRALSRDPVDRPASADNIVQMLQTVDVSERAQAERSLTPAFVQAVAQTPVTTTVRETRVVATIERRLQLSRKALAGIAGAVTLVGAAIVGIMHYTPPPPEEPPLPVANAEVVARSTAVLPFAVVGSDAASATLGAGLSIELSQRLAKHGIAVLGSASAGAFAAQGLDPRSVARRLGVSSILTGSMQRVGDSLHLNVALLSSANGTTLWSAALNRPATELFAVEDSITRAVAGVVQGHADDAAPRAASDETTSADAHLALLQANGSAVSASPSLLADAVRGYRAALASDSLYARAHASLALSTALLSAVEMSASAARVASITAEANRAIALDSGLADAWTALAYVSAIQGANQNAERLFRKALDRDSTVAMTWGWYGVLAVHVGDYATAHARVLRARTLEPASPLARAWDAMAFFGEQKFERAEQATRAIPRMEQGASIAMLTHVESLVGLRRDSAAVATLMPRVENTADGRDSEASALLAYACARSGQTDGARDILLAMRDATHGPLPARATLAATLAALGDVDSAIGLLSQAVARHDPVLFFFSRAARFDELRRDPRGAALFAKLER